MTPVTIITGASAGIGAELARVFARNGHALVLIARRADRLKTLAAELAAADRPAPLMLPLDLTRADAVARIQEALVARAFVPQYVVNNAGFGLLGAAAALDGEEQLAMIDLNVRVLTDLSLAFIDSLGRTRGGLLNGGSVAGFFPAPGMAVYYATKAYVLSFSEALHRELAPRGIRVTCLCPGPVETEFGARRGAGARAAEHPHRLGGSRRGRRLPRPDARATPRRTRLGQQSGDFSAADRAEAGDPLDSRSAATAPDAKPRAAHIGGRRPSPTIAC